MVSISAKVDYGVRALCTLAEDGGTMTVNLFGRDASFERSAQRIAAVFGASRKACGAAFFSSARNASAHRFFQFGFLLWTGLQMQNHVLHGRGEVGGLRSVGLRNHGMDVAGQSDPGAFVDRLGDAIV